LPQAQKNRENHIKESPDKYPIPYTGMKKKAARKAGENTWPD